MKWVIQAFEKVGDDLIKEIPLPDTELKVMQQLFGVPDDDPMYDVFPVTEKQKKYLEQLSGVTLDIRKFDFFVERL